MPSIMCESFKSLGLLLHTNPDEQQQEEEQEQERDPFLGGLRHAKTAGEKTLSLSWMSQWCSPCIEHFI